MSAVGRVGAAARGGPLGVRNFRLLSGGQVTSTLGDYCYAVALPWLVLSKHGGPVLLGSVLACYGVPRTVFIPAGGVLADKLGPRAIMLGADIVRCLLVTSLAVIATTHVVSLLALGPVAALVGAGEGLFLPASMALMPALLPGDQLQAGNAINGAAIQVGSLAGPAVGGIIVAIGGSAPAFAVDAATFAVSAVTLAMLRVRQFGAGATAVVPPDGAVAGTGAGTAGPEAGGQEADGSEAGVPEAGGPAMSVWTFLRQERLLQVIVVVCVVANFAFGGAFEVALPALAHARFGPTGYGAIISCLGAGGVLGTLAAVRAGRLSRPTVMAAGGFALCGLAVALIPFLGGLAGAAVATFVFGGSNGFGNTVVLTLVQRWTPPQLLGRVMSVVMLSSIGTFPLSVFVTGLLVKHLGTTPFFPVAGIVLAATIAASLTQRAFRDLGRTPYPPANAAAPVTASS